MHLKWMSQDCCFALVQRILGGSLGSNLIEVNDYDDSDCDDGYRAQVPFSCQRWCERYPEEGVGPCAIIVEVFHHQLVVVQRPELATHLMVKMVRFLLIMVMVRINILICSKSLAEHFVNTVLIRIYIHVTMFTMSSVLTTWWQNQLIRLTKPLSREGRLTAWWNVWMSPIFTFSAATLAAKATRTRASISTSETEFF